MSAGQKCEIIVRGFARLLGLEHQLEMPPEAQIHTFGVLKLDDCSWCRGSSTHGAELQARVEHTSQTSPCEFGS
jgi:hypothetical protein